MEWTSIRRHALPGWPAGLTYDHILDRRFGVLGEHRVNVLNLALDRLGGS
jgi:hypothetical protein